MLAATYTTMCVAEVVEPNGLDIPLNKLKSTKKKFILSYNHREHFEEYRETLKVTKFANKSGLNQGMCHFKMVHDSYPFNTESWDA